MSAETTSGAPVRIGLIGFGNVGRYLADRLDEGALPGAVLSAITARDLEKAAKNAAHLKAPPKILPLAEIVEEADILVECAISDAFAEIARLVLGRGRIMVALSAAGVPAFPDILDFAREHRARLHIASGALPGLDSIRCASEGNVHSVRLFTRIKPETCIGEPYFEERGYDFTKPPAEPVVVFEGTGREAAAAFPRHFNVAVALSLAGVGLDETRIELTVDPTIPGAIHHVEVVADEIQLSMTARNRPSKLNPKTSAIIGPSALAALRAIVGPLHAGS